MTWSWEELAQPILPRVSAPWSRRAAHERSVSDAGSVDRRLGRRRLRGPACRVARPGLPAADCFFLGFRPDPVPDHLDRCHPDRARRRGGARAVGRRAGCCRQRDEPGGGRPDPDRARRPGSDHLPRRHHRDRRAALRGHGARAGGWRPPALEPPGPHHGRDGVGADREPARGPRDGLARVQHARRHRARRADRGRAAYRRDLRVLDPRGDRPARRRERGEPGSPRAGTKGYDSFSGAVR